MSKKQFFEDKGLKLNDLRVFMNCGNIIIPTECFCGCKSKIKFSPEEQMDNFEKFYGFRFFSNTIHLKRFRIMN